MTADDLTRAAYHEAAHVVFDSALCGSSPESVSASEDGSGEVRRKSRPYSPLSDCQLAQQALIAMAGAIATERLPGEWDACCEFELGGARDDWAHIQRIGFEDKQIHSLLLLCSDMTDEFWEEIENLALALAAHQTLSGEQCDQILGSLATRGERFYELVADAIDPAN